VQRVLKALCVIVSVADKLGKRSAMARGRLYGRDTFQPRVVLGQIAAVQAVLWVSLAVATFTGSTLIGMPWSPVEVWAWRDASLVTGTGWMRAVAALFAAVAVAVGISFIVERVKRSLDFAFTAYFVHLWATAAVAGFPVTWVWWLTTGVAFGVAAALAEYLCHQREMQDIPIEEIMARRRRADAQLQAEDEAFRARKAARRARAAARAGIASAIGDGSGPVVAPSAAVTPAVAGDLPAALVRRVTSGMGGGGAAAGRSPHIAAAAGVAGANTVTPISLPTGGGGTATSGVGPAAGAATAGGGGVPTTDAPGTASKSRRRKLSDASVGSVGAGRDFFSSFLPLRGIFAHAQAGATAPAAAGKGGGEYSRVATEDPDESAPRGSNATARTSGRSLEDTLAQLSSTTRSAAAAAGAGGVFAAALRSAFAATRGAALPNTVVPPATPAPAVPAADPITVTVLGGGGGSGRAHAHAQQQSAWTSSGGGREVTIIPMPPGATVTPFTPFPVAPPAAADRTAPPVPATPIPPPSFSLPQLHHGDTDAAPTLSARTPHSARAGHAEALVTGGAAAGSTTNGAGHVGVARRAASTRHLTAAGASQPGGATATTSTEDVHVARRPTARSGGASASLSTSAGPGHHSQPSSPVTVTPIPSPGVSVSTLFPPPQLGGEGARSTSASAQARQVSDRSTGTAGSTFPVAASGGTVTTGMPRPISQSSFPPGSSGGVLMPSDGAPHSDSGSVASSAVWGAGAVGVLTGHGSGVPSSSRSAAGSGSGMGIGLTGSDAGAALLGHAGSIGRHLTGTSVPHAMAGGSGGGVGCGGGGMPVVVPGASGRVQRRAV